MYFPEWKCKKIWLRFHWSLLPRVQLTIFTTLIQIMAWRRPADKSLSEPMMFSLLTHIRVTRPQWVKKQSHFLTQYCVCLWSKLLQSFDDSQCCCCWWCLDGIFATSNSITAKYWFLQCAYSHCIGQWGASCLSLIYSDGWLWDQCFGTMCPGARISLS